METYKGFDFTSLAGISPVRIRKFAINNGWAKVELTNSRINNAVSIFKKNEEEILIPQNSEVPDYSRRIGDALSILHTIEGIRKDSLLRDLLLSPSDALSFRMTGLGFENGTMPLSSGISFFTSCKKILMAAACQAVQPSRYYKRLKRNEAEDFIQTCRLGQTQKGSYIINFICPVETEFDDPTPTSQTVPQESFTRKVTVGLTHGLGKLVNAIEKDRLDDLTAPTNVPVVSANLCDVML